MAAITVSYTTLALQGSTSAAPSEKRKAPVQVALPTALDRMNQKGKKRSVTLINGDELDLTSELPVTAQVLEAMRLRIIELEDELYQQPPLKRARMDNAAPGPVVSTSAPGSTAASIKADEKKRRMQVKKFFDRLKKECKADGVKLQGSSKTIKFDELYEQPEFEAFAVTIIHFITPAAVSAFFGDELKALKGNKWSRGGVPVRTFGGGFGGFGSTFAKSVKIGAVDVSIRSFEVNYSKNNVKCSLKFEVAQDQYDAYDSDY